MNTKGFSVFLVAACLFLSLTGCQKEPEEKGYKPYDFDLASYIRLGDILGVSYTPLDTTVTEEDIDIRLCRELSDAGMYDTDLSDYRQTALTEGAVKKGDTILFSCTATVDGEAYADGAATGQKVTVGENMVNLDGFDQAVVGLTVGEETLLTLIFPSDYRDFSLRGKEIVLTITVERIEERLICPETLTTEQLAALTDQPDLAAYRMGLRQTLEEERAATAEQKKKNDCWQAAIHNVTLISYPQVEIERYTAEFRSYMEQEGKEAGFSSLSAYAAHLGLTDEELDQLGMKYARGDVLQEMVVYAVARNEGFDKMSDELFARYALPLAEEMGLSTVKELTDVVGYDEVQKRVLTQVVKEYIAENGRPILPEPTETPEETT